MVNQQERLAVDGAFKRVASPQAVIGRRDRVDAMITQDRAALWSDLVEGVHAERVGATGVMDVLQLPHLSQFPAAQD
jgi:hypothetical protein